jgi:hypothetical protein
MKWYSHNLTRNVLFKDLNHQFITFQIIREADPSYQDLLIVNNFMFDRCLVQHETGSNQFHLEDFLSIVTRMSVFFASKIDWDDIGIDTSGLDNNGLQLEAITIGYSEEEEEWYFLSFSRKSCFVKISFYNSHFVEGKIIY